MPLRPRPPTPAHSCRGTSTSRGPNPAGAPEAALHRPASASRPVGPWAEDPTDELANLALMNGYVANGDLRAALRQFERPDAALRRELGVIPSPRVTAVRSCSRRPVRSATHGRQAAARGSPLGAAGPCRPTDPGRSRSWPDRPGVRSAGRGEIGAARLGGTGRTQRTADRTRRRGGH